MVTEVMVTMAMVVTVAESMVTTVTEEEEAITEAEVTHTTGIRTGSMHRLHQR